MTDAFPRRKAQIPDDPAVPRSEVLRGQPRKIVRRVLMDLQQHFPAPAPVHTVLISSPEAASLSARPDLRRLIRRWGVTSPAEIDQLETGYAVHHRGSREIALLRDCLTDLEAHDWPSRAKGVYALAHEYWHVLRVTPSRVHPDVFEEGAADLFSLNQTLRLTGYAVKPPVQAYPEFAAGVAAIMQRVAPPDTLAWLLQSRQQQDLPAWVEQELVKSGVPLDFAQWIAHNADSTAEWLAATQKLRR